MRLNSPSRRPVIPSTQSIRTISWFILVTLVSEILICIDGGYWVHTRTGNHMDKLFYGADGRIFKPRISKPIFSNSCARSE